MAKIGWPLQILLQDIWNGYGNGYLKQHIDNLLKKALNHFNQKVDLQPTFFFFCLLLGNKVVNYLLRHHSKEMKINLLTNKLLYLIWETKELG